MLVLFQEGIPGVFFPGLEKRGWTIARIPTDPAAAGAAVKEFSSAEALFFRANFRLGAQLLEKLPALRLAALVSTGADNVDTDALRERGIRLVTGEGANAQAVVDYVIQALALGEFDFARDSLGIIGAGRIGQRLLRLFDRFGGRALYYDPLLREPGSLEETLRCDVVTFHTELSRAGEHATAGMLDAQYFAGVKKKLRLIQASRGGIWNADFYRSLDRHPHLEILAQDVFPDEPPPVSDLSRARYSTPHIAGYSTLGRLGGIVKGIRAILPDFDERPFMPQSHAWFLDEEARHFAQRPSEFQQLRDTYFWRKEFHEYSDAERSAWLVRFPQTPPEVFSLDG